MIFSSLTFIFFFLPILLLIYYITPKKYRNLILLIFSLIFYIYGEKQYVILLISSALINYIIGKKIEQKGRKKYLILGLIINITILLYYKYANFFIDTFNDIFSLGIKNLSIILPLGISFYTFQNISYLIDVYDKKIKSEHNFITYTTYLIFFPELIAGPIVRYSDIKKDLEQRKENINKFSYGITRFVIGLSKKILLADTLYNMKTNIISTSMSTLSYWLVAFTFLMQIYYDFSGYSDMAIGLAKMFGFNLKENFNYPLISKSITEFWKRWHISLSSFFKDYVYIKLGGNKVSKILNIRNLLIVWLLTDLWHGASYNFIIWGLYFFLFIIIEKLFLKKHLNNKILSHIYVITVLLIGFVIFNITDITELITFIKGMFGINTKLINNESLYYLKTNLVLIIISTLLGTPIIKNIITKLKKGKHIKLLNILEVPLILTLFLLSISVLLSSSFNPFIYFRF